MRKFHDYLNLTIDRRKPPSNPTRMEPAIASPGRITRREYVPYLLSLLLTLLFFTMVSLGVFNQMLTQMHPAPLPSYGTGDLLHGPDSVQKIFQSWNYYDLSSTGPRGFAGVFRSWALLWIVLWVLVFSVGLAARVPVVLKIHALRVSKADHPGGRRFVTYRRYGLPVILIVLGLTVAAGIGSGIVALFLSRESGASAETLLRGFAGVNQWAGLTLMVLAGLLCLDLFVLEENALPGILRGLNLNRFHVYFLIFLAVLFRMEPGIDVARHTFKDLPGLFFAFLMMAGLALYFWIHGRNFIELYAARRSDPTPTVAEIWVPRVFACLVLILFGAFLLRAAIPVVFFPPGCEAGAACSFRVTGMVAIVLGLLLAPFQVLLFELFDLFGGRAKKLAHLRHQFLVVLSLPVITLSIAIVLRPLDIAPLLGNLGVLVLFMLLAGLVLYALEWGALYCYDRQVRFLSPPARAFAWVFRRLGYGRVPLLTLLIVWQILAGMVARSVHESRSYTVRERTDGDAVAQRSIEEIWCRWLTVNGLPADPDFAGAAGDTCGVVGSSVRGRIPLVFVSSAGGGIRAAYWTMLVMNFLTREPADRPRVDRKTIFAMSGVSGGSVGMLAWAALAKEFPAAYPAAFPTNTDVSAKTLGDDYLAPAIAAFLFHKLPARFLPLPVFQDEATMLETAWEKSWWDEGLCGVDRQGCGMAGSFAGLWEPWDDAERYIPLVIANGAEAQRGKRIHTSVLNGNCLEDRTQVEVQNRYLLAEARRFLSDVESLSKPGLREGEDAQTLLAHLYQASGLTKEFLKLNDQMDPLARATFNQEIERVTALLNLDPSRRAAPDETARYTPAQLRQFVKASAEFAREIDRLQPAHPARSRAASRDCAIVLPNSRDTFDVRARDINRSTAALLSARFPLISPPGYVPGEESDRALIVDGGYYDNSGAATTQDLYRIVEKFIVHYNQEHPGLQIVPVHIHIDNEYVEGDDPGAVDALLPETLVPVAAIVGGKAYQTGRALESVRREFDCLPPGRDANPRWSNRNTRYIVFNTYNTPGPRAPLSWLLSPVARAELDEQLAKNFADAGEFSVDTNPYLAYSPNPAPGACPFPRPQSFDARGSARPQEQGP